MSEALIQGSLQRPAEYEIYLGETGIFCRVLTGETEVTVGAGEAPVGAISLYPFA